MFSQKDYEEILEAIAIYTNRKKKSHKVKLVLEVEDLWGDNECNWKYQFRR